MLYSFLEYIGIKIIERSNLIINIIFENDLRIIISIRKVLLVLLNGGECLVFIKIRDIWVIIVNILYLVLYFI